MKRTLSYLAFTSLSLLAAPAARAQFGGQPGPGGGPGGMGQPPMGEEPKEEGPAEEAPEAEWDHPENIERVWSYSARFVTSPTTSYASATALKRSSAAVSPGWESGWFSRASLR